MSDIENTLTERSGTHGLWSRQAETSEAIWQLIKATGKVYSPSQSQALHMIALKLGRIIVGNENEVDHWRDIAGYATLAMKELEQRNAVNEVIQKQASQLATRMRGDIETNLFCTPDTSVPDRNPSYTEGRTADPARRKHCPGCGVAEGFNHKKGCSLLPTDGQRAVEKYED